MNSEKRISLRITDPWLIDKLEQRLEHTKQPLSSYLRELLEYDLKNYEIAQSDALKIKNNLLAEMQEAIAWRIVEHMQGTQKLNPDNKDKTEFAYFTPKPPLAGPLSGSPPSKPKKENGGAA